MSTELIGTIESFTFKSPDTSFAVLMLNTETHKKVVCVGELASCEVGEEVVFCGLFTSHPSFGDQFKVESLERRLPTTEKSIIAFLSGGAIKGLGPVIARAIVDTFGTETFEKITQDPMCLSQVKGITPKKAQGFAEQFKKLFACREVINFFESLGLSPTVAMAAWELYGATANDVLKKNPFVLCREEIGQSFETADKLAEKFLLAKDSESRITAGIAYSLASCAENGGHTAFPKERLVWGLTSLLSLEEDVILDAIDNQVSKGKLCENGELIALNIYDNAERYVADRLTEMAAAERKVPDNMDELIEEIESADGITYNSTQKKAIKAAVRSKCFVLTGCPGTGKTTTLNAVIKIFRGQGLRVSIAAPTGRAAQRITELTGAPAATIHRLLGTQVRNGEYIFSKNKKSPLSADIIIIDEMSMVDTLLFYHLLQATKQTATIILTGDANQLPSVSAGNVLSDIIESDVVSHVELFEIFRQAAQSDIIKNSHTIVAGEVPDFLQNKNDFFFLPCENMAEAARLITDLTVRRLPKSYGFSPTDDIQIIAPQKKGDCGVNQLNGRLQDYLNPRSKEKREFKLYDTIFREGDKVMQTRNNYDIEWQRSVTEQKTSADEGEEAYGSGIYNGDIGTVRTIDKAHDSVVIDFGGKIATYTMDETRDLDLAYAITIHKSQGNEFRAVIIPVFGSNSDFFCNSLIYTGITRAREILILVGSQNTFASMIRRKRTGVRYGNLFTYLTAELRA